MLKLFDYRWLMSVMLLTVAALPVRIHASTPTIVISEIAWAGSSLSAADEWIELANVSDSAVNLSGWTITGAGSAEKIFVLPDGATIEPQSTYLIANYEHTHANSALESVPSYVTTTLSLSNNGFRLTLSDAGGSVMDVAGGTGAPFAGGSGGIGDSVDGRYRSMVRIDGLGDGSLQESWTDADTSSGFKAGIQDLGTPGSMFFATIGVIPTASEIEEEGSPKQEPTELADPTIDKEIISTDTETLVIGQDDNIVSETIEKAVTEETITVEPVMEKVTQLETVLPEKPSPAPNTSPGSTKSVEAPKTLRFLSLYPNATGSDEEEEYILIENTGTEAVDLRGWSIEDESTDRYEFVASSVIQAGMTFTLGRPQSKLTLNNDGDTLTLIAPDGEMLDRVTYENSLQGETYDLIEETWRWSGATTVTQFVGTEPTATQSTPAASTITSIPSAATPTATTTARSVSTFSPVATSATSAAIPVSSSARSTLLLSISDAKQRLDGQRVIVKGIITAAPGTFGSQIFYLQDATGGIQAYLHSGDFPELSVGDGIQIMGELSTSHGERRVKLANASSIAWINGIVGSEPIELILSDTNESVLGQLMKTHGQIQSIDTNKLVIEETGATLTIYLKSSPAIDAQAFARGDKIEVIGVLTTYDGELRLRPRSTDDLQTVEKISGTMAVTSESTVSSSAGIILFSTTVTALIALALWRFLTHKRLTTVTA